MPVTASAVQNDAPSGSRFNANSTLGPGLGVYVWTVVPVGLSSTTDAVSATSKLPLGSTRKAYAASPGSGLFALMSGFCAFVLMLKLCTNTPSDVYSKV